MTRIDSAQPGSSERIDRVLAVWVAVAGLLAGCAAPSRWVERAGQLEGVIDLLEVAEPEGAGAKIGQLSIHQDVRRSLMMPGRRSFPVQVQRGARLSLAFGVDQEFWDDPATPVQYRVVIADGKSIPIWQGEIDPSGRAEDQKWHEADLALDRWAGQLVRLRLEAFGGRRAAGGQVRCGFAIPRIKAPAEQPRRDATGQALPNILLFVIDTLRADHLSGYGYQRPTSPNLDRLAAEGAAFAAVVSPSSWTKSSVASILTATYPFVHRANEYGSVLPDQAESLPEILRSYGYLCAGLVANGNIAGKFGFAQGFDSYRVFVGYTEPYHRTIAQIWPALASWLRAHADERFFLYLHTVDPHLPYDPPTPHRERFSRPGGLQAFSEAMHRSINHGSWMPSAAELAEIVDLYDGEIAFTDAYFERLDRMLAQLGLRENTIVAVTSDHGEQFLEHGGITHGITLFQEEVQVPLMLRYPPRIPAGLRIPSRVQALDLMPTLLELAGIRPPGGLAGRSLVPLLRHAARPTEGSSGHPEPDQFAFSQLELDGRSICALWDGPDKLLYYPKEDRAVLFNLARDPKEAGGRVEGERLESMRRKLTELVNSRPPLLEEPLRRELDDEQLKLLRALGYAQ